MTVKKKGLSHTVLLEKERYGEKLHPGRFLCDVFSAKSVLVPLNSLKGRDGMNAGTNPELLHWLKQSWNPRF